MVQTQAQPSGRRRKARSPSYPAIDLETAIERARALFSKDGRHWAPVEGILQHWGYSPKSSGGLLTLAALKKFGLLEDQGAGEHRQARVTPLAQKIILDERPNSRERLAAIREAALLPTIHAELWEEYDGSLPSDINLRYKLRSEKGFTESAANELIDEFRRTISFAALDGADTMSEDEADIPPSKDRAGTSPSQGGREVPSSLHSQTTGQQPPPPPPPAADKFVLSVAGGPTSFRMELPLPLSESQWTQLKAMLDAVVQPTLVSSEARDSAPRQVETQRAPNPAAAQDSGLVPFTRDAEPSLTAEAEELLRKADDGGVPAFMTASLARIAEENDIHVTPDTTPNQVIEELRRKAG